MKIRSFLMLLVLFISVAACSSQETNAITPEPGSNAEQSAGSSAFQAEASSAVSVQLNWEAVQGTEGYLLELSIGGSDFFTIALLDASQTSYEDFPVPDNTPLTYRLLAYAGGEALSQQDMDITTPAIEPNPLNVLATKFQGSNSFDNFVMPTFDPNDPNFDPSSLNIPGFDPETGQFDPSAIEVTPAYVTADIGPEGGQVSVTDPNGITYTLFLPEGALDETTHIILTPIESIDGLPLDVFLGAVAIEPEGLLLNAPAFLTIEYPDDVTPAEGMVTMNFAYEVEGSDFHFVPYYEGNDLASTNAGTLASLALHPAAAGPLSGVNMNRLGPHGQAQGAPAKVRNTVKSQPPKKSSSQKSNTEAASQMDDDLAPLVQDELAPLVEDELAPLPPDGFNDEELTATPPPGWWKGYFDLERQITGANTASEIAAALSNFESFYNTYDDKPGTSYGTNKLRDLFVEKLKKMFEDNLDKCLNLNAFTAAAIGEKMVNPQGKFWNKLWDNFEGKYGDDLIQKVTEHIKKCKFQFTMTSNVSVKVKNTTTTSSVSADFPLKIKLDLDGKPVFQGMGALKYEAPVTTKTPDCTIVLEIKDLQGSEMQILTLQPQWDAEGKMTDLHLDSWTVVGSQTQDKGKCGETEASGMSLLADEHHDTWAGSMTFAHPMLEGLIHGWLMTLPPDTTASSGKLGEKQFDVTGKPSMGGSTVTEKTIMIVMKVGG